MKKIVTNKKMNKPVVMDHPVMTSPQVDKLSGVIDLKTKDQQKLCGHVYSSVLDWVSEYEPGVKRVKGSGKFPLSVEIHLPGKDGLITLNTPHLLLQVTNPKHPRCQVRFEYNPAHMTEKGEQHLDGLLDPLFGMMFYELLHYARFTRIDLCLLMMKTAIEDILVKTKWAKVSFNTFGADGKLSQIVFGGSGGNQFKVYEKSKQLYGAAAESPFVRFEALLRVKLKYDQLMTIADPFKRFELYDLKCNMPPLGTAHWRAFQDSCRLRGVNNALKHQPADIRSKLKKHLSEHPVTWWHIDPEDWNMLLYNALDIAGLTKIPDHAPPLSHAFNMGQGYVTGQAA